MGKLRQVIEAFKRKGRRLISRTPDEWKMVKRSFQSLSECVGHRESVEEIESARRRFLEVCNQYIQRYKDDQKEADRRESVAALQDQIRQLSENDLRAAVFNGVSLEKYADKQESYYQKYQNKMIEYRSVRSAQIPAELKKMEKTIGGIDLSPVTGFHINGDALINEANVKDQIKQLDAYRRTCRELMEEGKRSWNFALEAYGQRLYRESLRSPLDNLRDLRLVRELERKGARIKDTAQYATPEIKIRADDLKTEGAGMSKRYSGVALGNTKGFLTPFKGGNFNNQVERIGEMMQRFDLSRQATAALNWMRLYMEVKMESAGGLEDAVRCMRNPDVQQTMLPLRVNVDELERELKNKGVFDAWKKEYGLRNFYQYAMGEEGQEVFEQGFIEKRNVAMSRVAELLGIGDVLARSRVVVFDEGGKRKHGCFMDRADGIQIGCLTDKQKEDLFSAPQINVTPEGWKQFHRLLILDTICGQVDRHNGNFFLQYRKNEDGKVEITGVKGIDNDLAFASRKYTSERAVLDNMREFSHVNGAGDGNSLFVDETVAEKIRNLTEDDLRFAVGDCLPETDIQALWDRTRRVKDLLDPEKNKTDHIVILKDDEKDWDFQRNASGRMKSEQTEHRLWVPGAPDREAFMRNFRIFAEEKESVSRRGCKLMRAEDSLRNEVRTERAARKAAEEKKTASEKPAEEMREKKPSESREKISFEELTEKEKPSDRPVREERKTVGIQAEEKKKKAPGKEASV